LLPLLACYPWLAFGLAMAFQPFQPYHPYHPCLLFFEIVKVAHRATGKRCAVQLKQTTVAHRATGNCRTNEHNRQKFISYANATGGAEATVVTKKKKVFSFL